VTTDRAATAQVFDESLWASKRQVQDKGYEVEYAGFTMKTVCCSNRQTYKFDRDEPCNGATSAIIRSARFFFTMIAAVVAVSFYSCWALD